MLNFINSQLCTSRFYFFFKGLSVFDVSQASKVHGVIFYQDTIKGRQVKQNLAAVANWRVFISKIEK